MQNEDGHPYSDLELDPATDAYTGNTRRLRGDDVPLYLQLEANQEGCIGRSTIGACLGGLLLMFCAWVILALLGAVIGTILT